MMMVADETNAPDPESLAPEPVVIASDHAGFDLKQTLIEQLRGMGRDPIDLGPYSADRVDYPDYGKLAAEAIVQGRARRGVLICGSGIGISIAANRHPGIRAALCHDHLTAQLSRQHNDANILVLGARLIGADVAADCLRTFLTTGFEGGRHQGRVEKLG